ncbi:MAG: zf-HC2 domain-containing protein [Bryobacterales bacterium]|nr:zf-HC2 domain-containing protein [Bryobacterales bacterium]
MRHEAAKEMLASERYLLGELTAEERDQFEEHFFTCAECAADVRAGAMLFDNLKAELDLSAPARVAEPECKVSLWDRIASWFIPQSLVPVGAALALAVVAGYQQVVIIPGLQRALGPTAAATINIAPETRGDVPAVAIARSARTMAIDLEITVPVSGSLYWTVLDDKGGVLFQLTSSAGPNVTLRLPTDKLPDGRYQIVAAAGDGRVLERYRFDLKRHDDWEH